MLQKYFVFQLVVGFTGRLMMVGILSLSLFSGYGCKVGAKLKKDAKTENREAKAALDKTAVLIPFYKRGSLAFSGQSVRKAKERKEQKRRKLEKKKEQEEELKTHLEERFKGLVDLFWVPPPEYSELFGALKNFPRDGYGYPDWAAAIRRKTIKPRDSIKENYKYEKPAFNKDIIFKINDRMMANVRFPHSIHNLWLSCRICHPNIFIAKKGANDFGMNDIWAGKFCGRCHGKVAFQPKGFENCQRCHSSHRKKVFFE